jgi:hypothetical protein
VFRSKVERRAGDAWFPNFYLFFFCVWSFYICKGFRREWGSEIGGASEATEPWGGGSFQHAYNTSPVWQAPAEFYDCTACVDRSNPETVVKAFVVDTRSDGNEKLECGEQVGGKIRAWLDSGANQCIFKEDPSVAKTLRSSNTRIDTAHRGDSFGSTRVGAVELKNRQGATIPGFGNVYFSGGLVDNKCGKNYRGGVYNYF